MRSLGIDVGRYSIKVVEILANNRNYDITNAKEYKILNLETSDQEIDIIQTLATIAKEFDTDSAKVTCSIRQQYVSTRKVFFPFKERAKIHKSLAFELEDDIPLSIDKAVYDSKIIKFHDQSAEVIAMACVTDEIEKTIEIMNRSKIDPDIVTPELCSIANLYEKWYKPAEEVNEETNQAKEPDKMIVHIGHSKTFVGVISNDYLVWGRSILWGAEKIAHSISQSFQVPFTTALDMMPSKAFVLLTTSGANKDQIKMSDSVTKAMAPLIQDLRLTIMLANTEYGANIENIEVVGGPSGLKNLTAYMTQELEISSNHTNPLKTLSNHHMKNHDRLNEVFQMSLGLAIEGLRRPFNPAVNFRQMDLAKKNHNFEKFWEKWGYTAKILATAYFCYLIYGVAMDTISTQLEEASNDVLLNQASVIAKLKGRTATPSNIQKYITKNQKTAELMKKYDKLDEINSPMKFINELSQLLPTNNKEGQKFDIRRLIIKDSEVSLMGMAENGKTVKEIQKALKSMAEGGKVASVPPTLPDEDGKSKFGFKISVKRKN